ncbi:VOC family protein [Flavihumibacter sp. R14]|nr:VOC family protein [Flavihumibacter soli]
MASINPYLTFNGNAEEAFNFYKSVFGGEFVGPGINRFKDQPGCEQMSEADKNKVMHVALPIGPNDLLMASDYVEGMGPGFAHGSDFSIALNPDSPEDARRLFDGLAAGGTVVMDLDKTSWAELFGMLTDKFGIQWMVNYGQGDS